MLKRSFKLSLTPEDFMARIEPIPIAGCWLYCGPLNNQGYGTFGGRELAHRYSYELHKGKIPTGLHILHTCDVRSCVNPEHLYAGTEGHNRRDALIRDRLSVAKLTTAQVQAIRLSNKSLITLAHEYKVGWLAISRIRKGKTWSGLDAS